MSETETRSEKEYDENETDWIANSAHGFGIGYTKEQALTAMAAYVPQARKDVEVLLVEHVGDATVSAVSLKVEHEVSYERITVPKEQFNKLGSAAFDASVEADRALEQATIEESSEAEE